MFTKTADMVGWKFQKPEMLEMLYTVLPSVEESDEFNKPSKKLGPIVRALIAKAEGRI